MEEPLYILEKLKKEQEQQQQFNSDIEMEEEEDDSFWQSAAKVLEKETTTTKAENDVDMDELIDTETPRFESLSVKDDTPASPSTNITNKSSGLKRKRVGEDVFTREAVKQWQGSRIKAWESRYLVNTINYIFLFYICFI
jgi:hypothetical protein